MTDVRRPVFALLAAALALAPAACTSPGGTAGGGPAEGAVMGGFLGRTVGQSLDQEGRARAYDAQATAIASGRPTEWRESATAYGAVEPGPTYTDSSGNCRRYAHTASIDGRAQTGSGRACRNAEGTWEIVE